MTTSTTSAALPPPQNEGLYTVMMVCTGNICRSAMAKVVLCDRLASTGAVGGARAEQAAPGSAAGPGSGGQPGAPAPGSSVLAPQRLASRCVPVSGTSVAVLSSGVSDEEYGNPIDPRARRVLTRAGYTSPAATEAVETHHAHRISDEEILGSDLLMAMTARHYRELLRRGERLGADPSRVIMYRALDPEVAAGQVASPVPGAPAAPGAVPDLPDPWYGSMEDFVDTLRVVERVSDALVTQLRRWA